MPSLDRVAASLLAALALGAAAARGQPSFPGGPAGDSPFLPAGGAGGGSPGQPEPYEMTGVSTTSQGTQVCIHDAQAKRSRWITVGSSDGNFRVLGYDPAREAATVSIGGVPRTLSLRKAFVTEQPGSFIGRPVAGPAMPGKPYVPTTETLKQEREARMLVSDLLEIGARQRKAYEEAQRKSQQATKPD